MFRLKTKVTPRIRLILRVVLATAIVAYIVFGSVVWWAMHQTPETFGHVMAKMPGPVPFLLFPFETAWVHARAGRLQIGDQAPDFSLHKLDHAERVQLSTLNKQQPVVLVFGSYT